MKKLILILLFFTGFLQAQTLQNPTYGNTTTNTLKIKTPATVTSVSFLTTIDVDGLISKIDPALLPLSTSTINAINTATASQISGSGTLNYVPIFSDAKALGNSIMYQTSEGVKIGNQKTSYGLGFGVSKLITSLDRHIYDDYSVLNATAGGFGFGVFDASTEMTGTVSNDHFNAFQSRLKYTASADMLRDPFSALNGFLVRNTVDGTGIVPRANGIRIDDIQGTGPVEVVKGLYIEPLIRGSISNMGLDVQTIKNYIKTLDTDYLKVDAGSSAYNTAFFTSNFSVSSKYYASIFIGKSESANQSASYGYVYNPSGTSFAYISPYGMTEGMQFAVSQNGNTLIGTNSDNGVNKLQVNGSILATNYNGSASLTGVSTAPTAAAGTNTTQIATTAFVQSATRPYKVYTALLTQTGTSAPVATVLENTLGGTLVWTRASTGVYEGTLAGVFVVNKSISFTNVTPQNPDTKMTSTVNPGLNKCQVSTINGSGILSDSLLSGCSIEIRVYN